MKGDQSDVEIGCLQLGADLLREKRVLFGNSEEEVLSKMGLATFNLWSDKWFKDNNKKTGVVNLEGSCSELFK